MADFLLTHIEAHKGDDSLYRVDRIAAYKHAADSSKESFPHQPMTPQQVRTKLHHLFDKQGVAGYKRESHFLKRRCVLCTPYNEAPILDPAGQTRWVGPLDYEEKPPIELGQEAIE